MWAACPARSDMTGYLTGAFTWSHSEADSIACFVAHGPHDDGAAVLEGVDHVGDAVEVGGSPGGVFGEGLGAVAHAVRFDVGFGDEVEAVFIAEFVEARIVRVMGSADGVDVELLHELDVFAHEFLGDVVAGVGIVVVAVDAFDEDGLAVDDELAVFDLGGFEADFLDVVVGGLSTIWTYAQYEGVKVGVLGSPPGDLKVCGGGHQSAILGRRGLFGDERFSLSIE